MTDRGRASTLNLEPVEDTLSRVCTLPQQSREGSRNRHSAHAPARGLFSRFLLWLTEEPLHHGSHCNCYRCHVEGPPR